ncbi:MAG: M24 family metallopeptidase [Nitrososphaeria archaeon]
MEMTAQKYFDESIQASKEAYNSLIKLLKERGIDTLVLFREENIRYVSGLQLIISIRATSDSYAAIVDDSGVKVLTGEDEYRRLRDYGSWAEVERYGSEGLLGKIKQVLGNKKEIGFEDATILNYLYQALSLSYNMKPASDIILQARGKKNRYEKDLIIRAAEILTHAVSEVPRLYRKGMTEGGLLGELEKLMREEGAEGFGTWGLLTSSDGLKYVHYFPKNREVKGMLNVNISVNFYGYYADIARVFTTEKLDREKKEKYDAFIEINRKLIDVLRPGKNIPSIANDVAEEYRTRLNAQLTHALGRGVGLELVEPPFIVPGYSQAIQADQAISTNPWVSLGDYSYKLVDTVLVEEDGPHLYTIASYDLIEL